MANYSVSIARDGLNEPTIDGSTLTFGTSAPGAGTVEVRIADAETLSSVEVEEYLELLARALLNRRPSPFAL